MKMKLYAANDGKAIMQVTTELGRHAIQISVGTNRLDWYSIVLNEEQSKAFKQFIRENDV